LVLGSGAAFSLTRASARFRKRFENGDGLTEAGRRLKPAPRQEHLGQTRVLILKEMRKLLTILVCAAAFGATAAERRAPGFALMDSKGVWHDLADFRGKPVLLALIQTTCPHCAAFAENLQHVQEKYGDRLGVIAVVVPPDNLEKAGAFVAGHNITYPLVFDMGQMCMSYLRSPDLKFPRLYIIDGNGMIVSDNEYSPLTGALFEGNGLSVAVERLLGAPRK
jgi:peroxiredoxin